MSSRRRSRSIVMLVAGLLLAPSAHGQQVRGTVAAESRVVGGAVVLLVDAHGAVVARTVTRDDGRYALAAPVAGRYLLRVLRIGYTPTQTAISLALGDTATREIAASATRVTLAVVRVSDERRCRVRPDSGSAAFSVWEEARKALLATQITATTPLYMAVRVTDRTLDAGGREVDASVRTDSGRAVQPFVSLAPDSLARVGYVVRDTTGYTVWAPDPAVLLSESFAGTHCLRLATRPNDSTSIGVAFEPAPNVKRADVRGTVWLDRASAELRALEFRYTKTEGAIEMARAGGEASFLRLPDGRWVIDRWRIRAPVVEMRTSAMGLVTPHVTALREFGGDVTEVRDDRASGVALWAREKSMARVRVLAGARPAANVVVHMAGVEAHTDSAGIASLGPVLPGSYVVTARPPAGMPFEETAQRVTVASSADPSIDVPLGTTQALIERRCGDVRGAFMRGIVRVENDAGAPVPGAQIDVTWLDHVEILSGNSGISGRTETRRTRSDVDGRFTVCDVPMETGVQVSATLGTRKTEPVVMLIERDRLQAEVSLFVSRATAAAIAGAPPVAAPVPEVIPPGTIVGVIRDAATGLPIRGAEVRVADGPFGAHTDSLGRYRLVSVPQGTRYVLARRLGYLADSSGITIAAQGVALDVSLPPVATRLTTVTVEATSTKARLAEFEQRMQLHDGGYFLGDGELLKNADRLLSDMIRTKVPAVSLERAPDGAYYLSNRRNQFNVVGGKNVPCVPQVFLNGMAMSDSTVSSYTTGELAGVEFHDMATTPAQYRRLGNRCGVLLLWSR